MESFEDGFEKKDEVNKIIPSVDVEFTKASLKLSIASRYYDKISRKLDVDEKRKDSKSEVLNSLLGTRVISEYLVIPAGTVCNTEDNDKEYKEILKWDNRENIYLEDDGKLSFTIDVEIQGLEGVIKYFFENDEIKKTLENKKEQVKEKIIKLSSEIEVLDSEIKVLREEQEKVVKNINNETFCGDYSEFLSEEEVEKLIRKIKEDEKKKAQEFFEDQEGYYEELLEKSKKETLTSKRIEEIEKIERAMKVLEIPFIKWEQPKIISTLKRTIKPYEVYDEEGQDEIIEKIISEFGFNIDDFNDNWEINKYDKEIKVEFGDDYSFDIILKGDFNIGTMGMKRLGLQKVENENNIEDDEK